ncbi:Peroxisomal membrane 22 kDa family protein [Perilla frutescens var. hirtella]|nr:Peroxisomal membrane 22 kDa family protein [Perilla frutescens var. frutescens]KAH6793539.1 Peroxisomal membrane 22 kDa family protein [Perilla frutescens var. hirtella]
MAASLSKIAALRVQCLHSSSKTILKHAISDQPAPPPHTATCLHRRARFSRYKRDLRKPKEAAEFPAPTAKSSFQNSRLVTWYLRTIKTHPIATKSATTALIYTAADITSQTMVGETQQYELVRTLRMAGYGMVILGPSLHYWYNFMSRVLPNRDLFSTLKKIGLGQTLYGPAMTVVFFSVNAALQGESASEIAARLRRDLLPTMIKGIMYWPVCDFLTFKFIPVHLQPLVVNSFSYVWTVYITYMASLDRVVAN